MIKIKLKALLKEKGVTQKELVSITGIRQPTLSAMNMGKTLRIKIEDMNKICAALNCQPGDIFEYIPEDDKTPQA